MQPQPQPTHVASLNGETVFCSSLDEIDALTKKHPNAGAPVVITYAEYAKAMLPPSETPAATTVAQDIATAQAREVVNTARAMADEATAFENGFNPAPPIYQIGTKVVEAGVKNARQSQLEHAAKPSARDVATDLARQVKSELRLDVGPFTLDNSRLTRTGAIALGEVGSEGKFVEQARYGIEADGFRRLAGRCIPAPGAGQYLTACDPMLRGNNWLSWAKREQAAKEAGSEQVQHMLRTRAGEGGARQVFGAVSPTYTAFDADKIAEALALAFPVDAKGTADYNGFRYRIEGLWHSDIQPVDFVAGEIFKAGVIVRGDDTGGGSIRVQSVIWRNLCLNLIILDRAVGVDIRIRHVGSVKELAVKFQQAFGKALTSVASFRNAWSRAARERDEQLVTRSQGTTADDLSGMTLSQLLPGFFNGILQRDLVEVKGRVQDVVPRLVELHSQDEAAGAYGLSRASIVNAFTRYAHQVETDPFAADLIREGAGRLLGSKGNALPAPLPFEAPATKAA